MEMKKCDWGSVKVLVLVPVVRVSESSSRGYRGGTLDCVLMGLSEHGVICLLP